MDFTISVGPHAGMFKRCGSSHNDMSNVKKKTFQCESKAIGVTLMITVKGFKSLSLCEVSVFGQGMAQPNISIANNIR